MAEVYRYDENTIGCFQYGTFYYGFENGSEKTLIKEPVLIYGQQLIPGDKITGFESGNSRTSFSLSRGFMTYIGKRGADLLFDIYDPKAKPHQSNLFSQRPIWLISFTFIGPDSGLLMFSQPGACYDIHPRKITKIKEEN